jgi:hypothetical protein
MTKKRWQFSLRWLISAVTIIALGLGLYAAFPYATEVALVISFFLFGSVAHFFIDDLGKKPWVFFLYFFAFGSWLLLVGIFRVSDSLLFFAIFASISYLSGVYFLVAWLRQSRSRDQ